MDFDNLHQVLRNLYQEMMPLCGDMIGVAKGMPEDRRQPPFLQIAPCPLF